MSFLSARHVASLRQKTGSVNSVFICFHRTSKLERARLWQAFNDRRVRRAIKMPGDVPAKSPAIVSRQGCVVRSPMSGRRSSDRPTLQCCRIHRHRGGHFGARRHVCAFPRRDMSRRIKATTRCRSPNPDGSKPLSPGRIHPPPDRVQQICGKRNPRNPWFQLCPSSSTVAF